MYTRICLMLIYLHIYITINDIYKFYFYIYIIICVSTSFLTFSTGFHICSSGEIQGKWSGCIAYLIRLFWGKMISRLLPVWWDMWWFRKRVDNGWLTLNILSPDGLHSFLWCVRYWTNWGWHACWWQKYLMLEMRSGTKSPHPCFWFVYFCSSF